MPTKLFEPKGDVAEWQMIYDHLVTLEIGATITYETLSAILGRDFATSSRGAFTRANLRLLETHKRGLLNVREVGYRVVTAEEHEQAARDQHRYAKHRMRRALHWIHNTDHAELSPEASARLHRIEETLERQGEMIRRLDARQIRQEKVLASTREGEAQNATRIAKLAEALERHGITVE